MRERSACLQSRPEDSHEKDPLIAAVLRREEALQEVDENGDNGDQWDPAKQQQSHRWKLCQTEKKPAFDHPLRKDTPQINSS